MARHRAEVRAVAVDGQFAVAAQVGQCGEADAVDVHHHAGAAQFLDQIVGAQHVVDVAADVEGVHRLLAGFIGGAVDLPHRGLHAFLEGGVRRISVQFIVLDEVEARPREIAH